MFGRRSHQRFAISTCPQGTLRMLRDVLVERIARDEVLVSSRYAAVVGDAVKIEMGAFRLAVKVGESRPFVSDGTVRHRLSLVPMDAQGGLEAAMSDLVPTQDPTPMVAVMAREIPVRLVNCSSSGCLLEVGSPIEIGRVASLRLAFEGQDFADDLQVVRCLQIEGSSSYHAGAEFLWTAAPSPQSLRSGIGRSVNLHAYPAAGH
jgi:hypothetical protein